MVSVLRADGDAELGITDFSSFVVPSCPRCSTGVLKPDVVFFGDSVHPPRVQEAFGSVEQCDGLLVVGTSLEVYSAYRFVHRASQTGKPIAIVNMGTTRAEREGLPGIVFKSESNCASLLKQVTEHII
jgi:NAD-dependent SIR2 family protein deacetylase